MGTRGLPGTWPLIGRQRELERIADARAAGAAGVVIGAAAGVGKTRLAEYAVESAGAGGAFTEWVRATRSSGSVPGAAFAHVMPAGTSIADGAACFRACVESLREQADGRDVVLGVDDAHLLDPASAALLLHLTDHAGVFAVVTIRASEQAPDAVTALWKDGGAVWLELDELDDDALIELVEQVLGAPLQHDTRRWLTGASGGNVLYAQHLVTGALEDGALIQDDGLWRLVHPAGQSTTLRQLVAARMGALIEPERRGLELLTLAEPLALADARALIDDTTLAELERKRLAVLEPGPGGGTMRLAQPLYGDLIASEMPVSRAYAHRLRLVELVDSRPQRSTADALRIAQWLTDAGQPVSAEILLDAARAARAAGLGDAGRFARLAVEAGAGPAANMAVAAAHVVYGRPTDAESAFAEVEGTIADRALAHGYLRARTTNLQWALGRGREAVALLDRARDWWPDDDWHRRIRVLRLPLVALAEAPGATVTPLVAALTDPNLTGRERRWLTRALAADRFWAGAVLEAEETLPESLSEMPLNDEVDYLELVTQANIRLASGSDLPRLERQMREAFEAAAAAADPAAAGLVAVTVGATSFLAGRLLDALRWLNEASAQSRRQDAFSVRQVAAALRVGVLLALGDPAATSVAADRLTESLRQNRILPRAMLPWVSRGRAWSKLAAAEPQQGQAILIQAADEHRDAPVYDAELRYEAMRAGHPARQLADAFESLAERCDAPLTAAYAAHVAARATGDAQRMLAAAETFAGLGVGLYAAEAAAHAAAAFAAEGRQDSARRAAARSRELQPADQGAAPLMIDGVDRAAVDLTPREAQMVELAARGLSNPEIAERLVLSTRTVETHIYRAMRKLGVSDRQDFRPRLAGDEGQPTPQPPIST